MLQVTPLRILVIISVGIILYRSLLYALGIKENSHLERRKRVTNWDANKTKQRFVLLYLFTLILVTILIFLFIQYKTGGVL